MHLIPSNKEEWQNLVPALFKAYVALAYIIWKCSSLYVFGESSSFSPTSAVMGGYLLSIVVLAFLAGIQIGKKQTREAVRTIIFIALSFALLLISFHAGSILNGLVILANILINFSVLCYMLNVRRSQKMMALTFWIWGCLINVIRDVGLLLCNYWLPPLGNNVSNMRRTDFWGLLYNFPITSFVEFYWLGFLLSGVLYVAGVILVIQKLRAIEQFKLSSNTAMFVALGFLAAMILMAISFMFLGHAEFLPAIVINSAIFYFCFNGYQQFKSKAFVFLSIAAILTTVRVGGLVVLDWYHNEIHNGGIYNIEQWLLELMLLGGVVAIVFWGTGIVLAIKSVTFRPRQPKIV